MAGYKIWMEKYKCFDVCLFFVWNCNRKPVKLIKSAN